jgi:hypothetical protein
MSDDADPQVEGHPEASSAAPEPAGEKQPEKKAKEKKAPKAKAGKDKGKGGDKGKGKGKGKKSGGLSVATHPRAHAGVRRAKGWGGLGGFVLAGYLSYRAGVPPELIGVRALIGGALGYMVAWATAVTVWRHLVLAELRAQYEQRKSQAAAATAQKPIIGGPKEDGSPR